MDKLEKTILGEFIALEDYESQLEVMMNISESYFTDPNAKIYVRIFNKVLFEKRSVITQATVYNDVINTQGTDVVQFVELVSDLSNANNIKAHIKLLKERKYQNDISTLINRVGEETKKPMTMEEVEEKKDELIIKLSGISLESTSNFIDPHKNIAILESNIKKSALLEGHSWGLLDLDTYTGGIVTPRLYVLGGLKKTGKSRFIINTMINLHKNKIPSVFLSLEMPEYEVVKLLISRYSSIPDINLRSSGMMSSEDKSNFAKAKLEMDWNLLNVECISRLNINQVVGRIRKYKKMFGNPVIFIDYLQRITHDRNKQAQELETIAVSIADATREYNCPIILLSQLANDAERNGVSIGSLKGSGGIGEAADVILLLDNLYRKQKSEEFKNIMDCYIEQRYGDSGKITFNTDLGTSKFHDHARFNNSTDF